MGDDVMSTLIIYTPCTQPEGIPSLALSVAKCGEGQNDVVHVIDYVTRSNYRHCVDRLAQRMGDLATPDTWFWFISDDTLANPAAVRRWRAIIHERPEARCIMFPQKRLERSPAPAELGCGPAFLQPGQCDGGQFLIHLEWWRSHNVKWDSFHTYEGATFGELHRRDPGAFVFDSQAYSLHDGLIGVRELYGQ